MSFTVKNTCTISGRVLGVHVELALSVSVDRAATAEAFVDQEDSGALLVDPVNVQVHLLSALNTELNKLQNLEIEGLRQGGRTRPTTVLSGSLGQTMADLEEGKGN